MDFQYPAPGPITSPFGPRTINGRPNFHNGFDQGWLLADPEGSKRLFAPADGTVDTGYNSSVGNYVGITVNNGWRLRRCHLASVAVTGGQRVKRGDFLGVMGDTGDLNGAGVSPTAGYGGGASGARGTNNGAAGRQGILIVELYA